MKKMSQQSNFKIITLFLCLVSFTTMTYGTKRPFYVIGHMCNSVEDIQVFLDKGANVLESDIQFFPNGSVKEVYSGYPCECNPDCLKKASFVDFLKHIRDITDPEKPNSYYGKMLVNLLDMKLTTSSNRTFSGQEIARHVLDYLWSEDGSRKQEVRIRLYFGPLDHSDVIPGFISEFRNRGKDALLANIGFDGGSDGNLTAIRDTFRQLGVTDRIWVGGGSGINCYEYNHPDASAFPDPRMQGALSNRESNDRFLQKVYAWTNDYEPKMRKGLELGVDGIITNVPDKLVEMLKEPEFEKDYRVAGIDDCAFSYFDGN